MTPARSVEEVLRLFEEFGSEFYGENVTQLDHALQCAALAERDKSSATLTAAALLHDVGHLLELRDSVTHDASVSSDQRHEALGAEWLTGLFPEAVTAPIAGHVTAKRWHCTRDADYEAKLSVASAHSLVLQGGHLSERECRTFEETPSFLDSVALRDFDDAGKVEGLRYRNIRDYEPLLMSVSTTATRR